MVRRGIAEPEKLAFYVAFAPGDGTTLEELVRVAGTRWRIESCFEAAKSGFGLDEYEVRPAYRCPSGWSRKCGCSI